ncbi:unnamed protein product [Rotaria sp. Silwood1]|nr:unnamed protein product [Rotaria sp. Silwood1]
MINNEPDAPFNSNKQPRHPGFTIGRKWHLSFSIVAICLSVLNVIFASGQSIGLVLFLGSFNGLTGVYFVLFFCSLSFTIVFSIMSVWFGYKKQITHSMRSSRWIKYMLLVGVFDAANGFLFVFSSHGTRVPPALSSILIQSIIPCTFIFSKFLLPKKYHWRHILSVALVLVGVGFSLIPTFKRIHDGTAKTELKDGWYWPFIFIVGCIPAALMNIVQEQLQIKYTQQARENQEKITRFSVMYFQAVESTFQFCTIALCFALDLVPKFGTSNDIHSFWTSFSNGFKCFFNDKSLSGGRCHVAGDVVPPDGARLVVELEAGRCVDVVPPDGARLVVELEAGRGAVVVPPDGARLVVELEAGRGVDVVPPDGARLVVELEAGRGAVVVPPDGARLVVELEASRCVDVVPPDGGRLVVELKAGRCVDVVPPDGARLVVELEAGRGAIVVPPDGARLVVEVEAGRRVDVVPSDGARLVVELEAGRCAVAVPPDGARLVVELEASRCVDVVPPDGGRLVVELEAGRCVDVDPPDGARAVVELEAGRGAVVVPPDGRCVDVVPPDGVRAVGELEAGCGAVVVPPDGARAVVELEAGRGVVVDLGVVDQAVVDLDVEMKVV